MLCSGWCQDQVQYLQQHPRTRLIDPFEAVQSHIARDSMLRPLAEAVTLHAPTDGRLTPGTAELDTLSCAALVQAALQEGTSLCV